MATITSFLRPAAKMSYDNSSSALSATNIQAAIDELDSSLDGALTDISNLETLSGVGGATDLGTFTGVTIPDTSTIKAALQALETAYEETDANVDDLITLSGVAENATDLGTFTGATISGSSTVKAALQELETAHEETDANVDDLITLSGVAENATDLGTFTGATIAGSSTIKAALQSLETAYEETDANVDDLITLSGVAENATDLGTFTGSTIADSSTIKAALQSLETSLEAVSGLQIEWQDSALDYVVDNTAAPATEVSGDRYILSHDGGAPNAAYDGASAGDIVEFDGSVWVATTPTVGTFVSADDESDVLYYWGGSSWSVKQFENTTASTGLTKVGADIQLASSSAGAGLGFAAGVLSVNVDDSSLEIATDTLQVKADGINDTHIDFGTGANQVSAADLPIADGGGLITATDVEGALAENRTAIDAIEDNTITSPNGSISVAGTVGGDDQTVDVVFSTAGAANSSIEASALASTANGEGASLVGVEDSAGNYTATTVEGVLTEIDGRLDTLEAGGTLDWEIKTAAYTAADGDKLLVDTSGGAVTITLPASPSAGDEVVVRDAKRTSETNAITVARNAENIGGLAEDLTIDLNGAEVHLVYVDAGHGWSLASA